MITMLSERGGAATTARPNALRFASAAPPQGGVFSQTMLNPNQGALQPTGVSVAGVTALASAETWRRYAASPSAPIPATVAQPSNTTLTKSHRASIKNYLLHHSATRSSRVHLFSSSSACATENCVALFRSRINIWMPNATAINVKEVANSLRIVALCCTNSAGESMRVAVLIESLASLTAVRN